MKAHLRKRIVLRNLPTEEQLLDQSMMESIYVIRKLKALLESEFRGDIEVSNEPNSSGQHYSKEFKVWFNKEELI
jgi:hypothetical protein